MTSRLVKTVKYKIELIGPKEAAAFLQKIHPRQPGRNSETTVEFYAKQIDDGTWDENVLEPIAVDTSGGLVDGYHRLRAIIKTGKKLSLLVVRGTTPSAYENWNAGKPRATAWRAGMGKNHGAILSYVIRAAYYPGNANRVSVHQLKITDEYVGGSLQYLEANTTPVRKKRIATATVRTGLLFAIMQNPEEREKSVKAYNCLVTQNLHDAPKSVAALFRRLMEDRLSAAEIMVLSYMAFTPSRFSQDRLRLKDVKVHMHDIQQKILGDLPDAIM